MYKIYVVYLHKDVRKTLLKIPKGVYFKIIKFIDVLGINPLIGLRMNGNLSHLRKIKVSNYRIIYQIIEDRLIVEVIEIESRGNVFYDK